MARSRREKTLADYVVIAISPVLIMTLVGSLAFFLLEVSYRGQFRERLMWVLFCFVFGAVLVARIAIEEGKERANLFGLLLGGATAFFAFRFVDTVFVAWTLLAVIWFCAWKLVFDCTLIDDDEDASGEGLLQAAGFDPATNDDAKAAAAGQEALGERRDFRLKGEPTSTDAGLEGPPEEPKRRPHSPGLWVVYFSLAALPLFGIGQLFIPKAEADRRSYAFQLLALYVASALGLLLSTSFLGLRRYLRQRKLQMPAAMTGSWLGIGAGMALVLLLLALFIPRPQGEYTLTQLVDKIDEKARQASKVAMLGGDKGEGEGRRIGQQDPNSDQPGEGGKPPDQQGEKQGGDTKSDQPNQNARDGQSGDKQEEGQGKSPGEKEGQGSGDGKGKGNGKNQKQQQDQAQGQQQAQGNAGGQQKQPGQKQAGEQKGGQAPKGGQAQEARAQQAQPPAHPPSQAPSSSFLGQLAAGVKWLIYGALALVGIYLLFRNWSRFVAILAQLWAELLSLFGVKREEHDGGQAPAEVVAAVRLRPFASYENPFFSGADRRMTPAQLALYTFDALEAWAREKLVARPPEQTPLEFAEALSQLLPELTKDVTQTAQLYARVVYAKKSPTRENVEVLERLWRRMGT